MCLLRVLASRPCRNRHATSLLRRNAQLRLRNNEPRYLPTMLRLIAPYCGLLHLIAAYCGLMRLIAAGEEHRVLQPPGQQRRPQPVRPPPGIRLIAPYCALLRFIAR